jgi:hypothetical protein
MKMMVVGVTLLPSRMHVVLYYALLVVLCLLPVQTMGFTTTTSTHGGTPLRRHHYHCHPQSPIVSRLAALSTEDKQYYVVQQTVRNLRAVEL